MKKSPVIVLGLTLLMAQACSSKKEEKWISGEKNSKDTTVHGRHYRSYHGMYYPIFANRISPGSYQGSSVHQISQPSHTPVRTGGFGSSGRSHSSSSHSSGGGHS
ncbi:MAG: hypothetical protein H7Y04_02390 [Verrucomicrobia bacterium]|nr:hypothetical protein [Cytophagales bacterium]